MSKKSVREAYDRLVAACAALPAAVKKRARKMSVKKVLVEASRFNS